MAELNRRLHILVTEELYLFLQDLSRERRQPVGELIRYAVEKVYRPSSDLREIRALGKIRQRTFLLPVEPAQASGHNDAAGQQSGA